MSASTVATTTYPFSLTTYTNASPSAFTKPTVMPSVFSFGGAPGCSARSDTPAQPTGSYGGCAISNAAEVNDHAFWDMYACCSGGEFSAIGMPFPCTAVCEAKDGQSFQELGECLSKRVETVVCKPASNEIGSESGSASGSSSVSKTTAQESTTATETATGTVSGGASGTDETTLPESTGAANTVHGVPATSSKAAFMIFGLVAVGSAAGMFL
jgi:hypothetical protein